MIAILFCICISYTITAGWFIYLNYKVEDPTFHYPMNLLLAIFCSCGVMLWVITVQRIKEKQKKKEVRKE